MEHFETEPRAPKTPQDYETMQTARNLVQAALAYYCDKDQPEPWLLRYRIAFGELFDQEKVDIVPFAELVHETFAAPDGDHKNVLLAQIKQRLEEAIDSNPDWLPDELKN